MPRCKAPEILRSEACLDVRRNKPAPCLTRGRVRETQQMGVFQQPANLLVWGGEAPSFSSVEFNPEK
jgi:hypothetical protein